MFISSERLRGKTIKLLLVDADPLEAWQSKMFEAGSPTTTGES
jgi:hypothetical protein